MENQLEPVLIKGGVAVDDRGVVTFCNEFDMAQVRRFYMLDNHEAGFIRAWHGHIKEVKWVTVVSGVAIIGVAKMYGEHLTVSPGDVQRYVMYASGDVLYIPPGYANGHKNLVAGTRILHFSSLLLSDADDYRFSWLEHGDIWRVKPR